MPLINRTKLFQQFLCETISDIDRKNLNKRREKKESKQKEWLQSTKNHGRRIIAIFFFVPDTFAILLIDEWISVYAFLRG